MYSTCLFCHHDLQRNDALEEFPLGRRLAYDPARGRLWVICSSCRRWNLSPIEERWEAVEACERLFRASRLRVATENIGMARAKEGLDLVRIGSPMRPEFAGWRYGSELLRRHRKDLLGAGTVLASTAGISAATVAVGFLISPFALPILPLLAVGGVLVRERHAAQRPVARIADDRGETHLIRARHLKDTGFSGSDDTFTLLTETDDGPIAVHGEAALRLTSILCARRNNVGGSSVQVTSAVKLLEDAGGPDEILRHIAHRGRFNSLWYAERLALEIAVHEDTERRALEGELQELELAWQDAEEIAGISDNLLLG